MDKARQAFDNARDRGDKYMLIVQKRQENADNLTFAVTGGFGKVEFARAEFTGDGPWTSGKWGYSYVGRFSTNEPWEEHESYLRALSFEW